MSVIVAVKAIYELVGVNRGQLEAHCDDLMKVLLKLERDDRRVRDAAVSMDASQNQVEVESICEAPDYETAASLARERITHAVQTVTGRKMVLHERHSELVSA